MRLVHLDCVCALCHWDLNILVSKNTNVLAVDVDIDFSTKDFDFFGGAFKKNKFSHQLERISKFLPFLKWQVFAFINFRRLHGPHFFNLQIDRSDFLTL